MVAVAADDGAVLVASGASVPASPKRNVTVTGPEGRTFRAAVRPRAIANVRLKLSLWALGGMFILLGAAVLLRRPDLDTARFFAAFAAFTAFALAVGPAAGGPGPPWALGAQILTLMGVGATFPAFVGLLVSDQLSRQTKLALGVFWVVGAWTVAAYLVVVLEVPSWYEYLRPVIFLYAAAGLLAGMVWLGAAAAKEASEVRRQQARIALGGMLLSALPFVGLTLLPEALGASLAAPAHLAILPLGMLPAFFAYAILQHQLLGIRRLVHRGMVYGFATAFLLLLMTVAVTLITSSPRASPEARLSPETLGLMLGGGVILFFLLRRAALWMVNSFVYRDAVSYEQLLSGLRTDLRSTDATHELGAAIVHRLAQSLKLEAASLWLGLSAERSMLVAEEGQPAVVIMDRLRRKVLPLVQEPGREVIPLSDESESFLLIVLRVSDRYLGHLVLGPKSGGDVFIDEEMHLAGLIPPVLALAIEKSELSDELQQMNHRLISAEELERRKFAADLHDGPLQRAVLLAAQTQDVTDGRRQMAVELVAELRELCSRLRPAVLDDLGLISALDWLIEQFSSRHNLSIDLSLSGVTVDERFSPAVEQVVFRVAQEALNNVVKHAHAKRVEVRLVLESADLVLTVADHGVGFAPSTIQSKGLGIEGMRERLFQVRGTLELRSALGTGTVLIARIPTRRFVSPGELSGTPHKSFPR